MKQPALFILLIFIASHALAQQIVTRKLKADDAVNYALQQVAEIQTRIHEQVLKEQIIAYQSVAFTKRYSLAQLETRGGRYETIQYVQDQKDLYDYHDTSLLTAFTPDHFTAMTFIGRENLIPASVNDVTGIAMYYAPTDTTEDVIYYVSFPDIRKALTDEQVIILELGLKQAKSQNNKRTGEQEWISVGAALFTDLKLQLYNTGIRNNTICYTDPTFTNLLSQKELNELEQFTFLKKTGDNTDPVPRKFEPADIDFIAATVSITFSDSATILKPVAFCPGHYLVITGVDNLERHLFWLKQVDLFPLYSTISGAFLKRTLYYNYLDLLDGNKTYTSDYLLRKQ